MIVARIDSRAVENALRRLERGLPLRGAVDAALEPLLGRLRRATPVDTGALRDSASIAVEARGSGAVGRIGWSGRRGKVLAVEFGSRGRSGQRVLSRLFDEERGAMARRFGDAAGAEAEAVWAGR